MSDFAPDRVGGDLKTKEVSGTPLTLSGPKSDMRRMDNLIEYGP